MKRLKVERADPVKITEYGRVAFRIPENLKHWIDEEVSIKGNAKTFKTKFISECIVDFLDSTESDEVLSMTGLLPPSTSKHIVETASLSEPLRIRCWWAAIDNAISLAKGSEPVYVEPSISHVIKSALWWSMAKKKVNQS